LKFYQGGAGVLINLKSKGFTDRLDIAFRRDTWTWIWVRPWMEEEGFQPGVSFTLKVLAAQDSFPAKTCAFCDTLGSISVR
jgi:hypothetical protein